MYACGEEPKDDDNKFVFKTIRSTSSNSDLTIIDEDSLKLIRELGLVYYLGKPFTGTGASYFKDKTKAIQIDYLNGKKHIMV